MKSIKVSEMTGAALDWSVAKCEGLLHDDGTVSDYWQPSELWEQGGPIIEREIAKIERFSDSLWEATAFTKNAQDFVQRGTTSLTAAMRCYVASKLGDTIEVPEELF
jgi:hypothetical protein